MARTPLRPVLIDGYVCKKCHNIWDTKRSKYGRNPDPICKQCGSAAKDIVVQAKVYGYECDCGKTWRPQRKIVDRGTIMCAKCHNSQVITDKDQKMLYRTYFDIQENKEKVFSVKRKNN